MPDDRASRLLDEFSEVTGAAPRPESPSRRTIIQHRFPVATLSGASLVIVTIAIAAFAIGRAGPASDAGSSPSAPAPTASATTTSSPAPAVAADPTTGPCDEATLAARITSWEGAAGTRIANVRLTNAGASACVLGDLSRPVLLGAGKTLINGRETTTSRGLTLAPGQVVSTLVAAGNYCGPTPDAPVTVAFVFADDRQIVADPVSATDATIPPCNGAGSAATIDMHAWAP